MVKKHAIASFVIATSIIERDKLQHSRFSVRPPQRSNRICHRANHGGDERHRRYGWYPIGNLVARHGIEDINDYPQQPKQR